MLLHVVPIRSRSPLRSIRPPSPTRSCQRRAEAEHGASLVWVRSDGAALGEVSKDPRFLASGNRRAA